MKKLLFAIGIVFAMAFAGCEKEQDPQLLSDFIVGGEWVYEQIEELQTLTFTGEFFSNGTYVLSLTDGNITLSFDGDWSVDNETNVLSLDEPDIEQDGETGLAYFNVVWTEGVDKMVWTQIGNETNILTWNR